MADDAKSMITDTVVHQGHSASYGALLYTFSLLGQSLEPLEPENETELAEWHGYRKGLRSALTCLAMYERGIEPDRAAQLVDMHFEHAVAVLERLRDQGAGG